MESNTQPKKTDLCSLCGNPNPEPLGVKLTEFNFVTHPFSHKTESTLPSDWCYHMYYDLFEDNFNTYQEYLDKHGPPGLKKVLEWIQADNCKLCTFTHLKEEEKLRLNIMLNTFAQILDQNTKERFSKITEWILFGH